MLCQYLAVFGRDDDERRDEDAICSGQKLKGGRAGVAGGLFAQVLRGRAPPRCGVLDFTRRR